jgi:N-acyl-phosphatidylethanolamine-hydrolysing phospholipase D
MLLDVGKLAPLLPQNLLQFTLMRLLPTPVALLLAAFAGLASSQPAPQGPDGYRNNYPHPGRESFWAWQWERLRDGLPPKAPPGGWELPAVKTDPAALHSPDANPSVTWIGHATMLVRLAGMNILFDPIFSERASPVGFAGPRRVVPLPIDIPDLPKIDVVMISHNHYDHLDVESVLRLAAMEQGSPRFLVPMGLKAWFATLGITRVDEYDWWQETRVGGLRITFVPVQHWSKRRLDDANRTLWGGWVVEGEGVRLIHVGDTGYSPDFRDIGRRLGPFDMAFIPIGSYAPRWFMQVMHVDVPEAVQIRADLNAARAIGMHWGTFESLSDEPLDEPPRVLARERQERGLARAAFDVMKIGETRRLEAAGPAGAGRAATP